MRGEDLFPTLLDYAGAQPLPDRRGISLRPFIDSGQPVGHDARVVPFRKDDTLLGKPCPRYEVTEKSSHWLVAA